MKPRVFITRPVPGDVEQYIKENCEYNIWNKNEPIPKNKLFREIAQVEGILTANVRIDDELLRNAPNLKIVSDISVGYDNFNTEAMSRHGVIGTHTPYVLDETVADLAFGLIISVARRIPELDRYVKDGKWKKGDDEDLFGLDVHGSTLGIIGMGRIGEKVARRAIHGFRMKVLYYNRKREYELEEKLGVKYNEMDELLRQSDFILLLVPLKKETYHMIGETEFHLMKKNAIFVNCSRGQTVDEKALIRALEEGKIKGAGLDVFEREPVENDNPLLKMDNVVTVPHIGSATTKTRFEMAMRAAKNLVAGVRGEIPPDIVKELKHLITD